MGLACKGCQMGWDTFCNCSLEKIAFENTFPVFVIMESTNNFGTQWCPLESDGGIDCPLTRADKSHFVRSPQQIKLLAISINLAIYLVALGSATFLIRSK